MFIRIALVRSHFNKKIMSRSLVSFRIADDLKLALKEKASAEGISTTELVNRLLRQGLSDNKVGFSFSMENRLSELEKTVQNILKMFEFERQKRETFSQPDYLLERRLIDVEEKLQQMFIVEEDRRRRIETLIAERSNAIEESQDACQDANASNSVGVSLEDLLNLLKPASQFIEVE